MDSTDEMRGFLRQAKVEVAKLEKKIFNNMRKTDELRNELHDKHELLSYFKEQVGDDDEDED